MPATACGGNNDKAVGAATTTMPALPLTSDCLAYDAVGQVDQAYLRLAHNVAAGEVE